MKRLLSCWLLVCGLASADPVRLGELEWLSGCWGGDVKMGFFEECWTWPRGDSMQGSARIVSADGRTLFREFMLLEALPQGITLTVRHFGSGMQAESEPVPFRLVSHEPGRAVFENPQHDSPQRIVYTRQPDGSLQARVEKLDGTERLDFPMRPLSAPAPSGR